MEGALRRMPRSQTAERAVLEALRRQGPRAFAGALQAIPRSTRLLYVHAYQSFLWNAAASHRVATFGTQRAVEGDLVMQGDDDAAAAAAGVTSCSACRLPCEEGRGHTWLLLAEAEDALPPEEDDVPGVAGRERGAAAAAGACCDRGGRLRQERTASTTWCCPSPGCRIRYPEHATAQVCCCCCQCTALCRHQQAPLKHCMRAQVYSDMAARDGVSLASPAHKHRDFSLAALPGGLPPRAATARPTWPGACWPTPTGTSPSRRTDLQRLQGEAAPRVTPLSAGL